MVLLRIKLDFYSPKPTETLINHVKEGNTPINEDSLLSTNGHRSIGYLDYKTQSS